MRRLHAACGYSVLAVAASKITSEATGIDALLLSDRWCHTWRELERALVASEPRIQTVNAFHLHRYRVDRSFVETTRNADLLVPDGWPLVFALRWVRRRHTERVTGSDLCVKLLDPSWQPDIRRLAIVGGDPDAIEEYAARLRQAGRCVLYRDTSAISPHMADDAAQVCKVTSVELVLTALPSEPGERMAAAIREAASVPIVCVGAGPEMITGNVRRAPMPFRRLHLEWCWRLAQEPRRLWRRYIVQSFPVVLWHLPKAAARARRRVRHHNAS